MSYILRDKCDDDRPFYPWLETFFDDVFKPIGPSKWSVKTKETKISPRWFYTEDRTQATVTFDIPGVSVEGVKVTRFTNQVKIQATGPGREYTFEVPLCLDSLPDTLAAEVSNGVLTLRVGMKVTSPPASEPVSVKVTSR